MNLPDIFSESRHLGTSCFDHLHGEERDWVSLADVMQCVFYPMLQKYDLGAIYAASKHHNTHQQHLVVLLNLPLPFISGRRDEIRNLSSDKSQGVVVMFVFIKYQFVKDNVCMA